MCMRTYLNLNKFQDLPVKTLGFRDQIALLDENKKCVLFMEIGHDKHGHNTLVLKQKIGVRKHATVRVRKSDCFAIRHLDGTTEFGVKEYPNIEFI